MAHVDDVTAVVVTFCPELSLLERSLDCLGKQVVHCVVVDNGSSTEVTDWLTRWQSVGADQEVIFNQDNRGIAAALNQGIAHARARGAGFVLLCDQDSVVEPEMVAQLKGALAPPVPGQAAVAAAGPVFVDRRTGLPAPFVRIGWLFNRKIHAHRGQTVPTDFLISSGCLVPLAVIDAVGGMNESLFIDNVDLDWCFRARAAGYCLVGVEAARMAHAIGDRVLRFGGSEMGVSFNLHSPLRLYYMTRNRIWLYFQPYTPTAWISQDIPRLFLKAAGMALFSAPRWWNMRAMWLGAVDGLRGRTGRCRHRT